METKIIYRKPLKRQGWHKKACEVLDPNGICSCITIQSNNLLQKVGIDLVKNAKVRDIANTIKARYDAGITNYAPGSTGVLEEYENEDLVRNLTPRECFRLMGVKDEDFERVCYGEALPVGSYDKLHKRTMKKNEWKDYWRVARHQRQSNSSLYHLAGDSIVVNVLMAIVQQMTEVYGGYMLNIEQIYDIGKLQEEYDKLFKENKVTNKSLNDLCYPFAAKYQISLKKSIEVAKSELDIWQIEKLLNKKK